MSEFDELDRLREADPAKATAIPSADDPRARGLRERILMTAPEATTTRRTRMFAGAAAVIALLAAGSVVLATRGSENPAPKGGAPISPPGQAMCVEQYSLDTLKNRQVAFDGSVVRVSGDEVTFTVNESFKGPAGDEVTLKGASTLGGITSAGDPISLDPGSRLLVAGDGGFAWTCGFTQTYDQTTANEWREALR